MNATTTNKRPTPKALAPARCSTARPATPRVDAVEYASLKVKPSRMVVDADFARQIERELYEAEAKPIEMAETIDRLRQESEMNRKRRIKAETALANLKERIAALSNPQLTQ